MSDSNAPEYVKQAILLARRADPGVASMGEGTWDCLLVNVHKAERVKEALGDYFDFEDPNDPPATTTRILVKDPDKKENT